ncbi:MAG: hypothetical protein PHN60_01550 [Candidatus Gracilibacteria bacterium]|nr:hypothetical protein [Candidatus Gracilibacteria bacterium]
MKKLPLLIGIIILQSLLLSSCSDSEDTDTNYQNNIQQPIGNNTMESIQQNKKYSRKFDTKTRAS